MNEWITITAAKAILHRSARQTYHYAEADPPRVRTQRQGKRMLFHRGDVETLAAELAQLDTPAVPLPPEATQLLPAGETLALIRDLQDRLMLTSHRVGELEAQLAQRLLPEAADDLRARTTAAEQENTRLQAELERLQLELDRTRRPWWRRWISHT